MSRNKALDIQSIASPVNPAPVLAGTAPGMTATTQQMAAPTQAQRGGLFDRFSALAIPQFDVPQFQGFAPQGPYTPSLAAPQPMDLGGWGGTGGAPPPVAMSRGGVRDDGRAWIEVQDQGNDKGGLLEAPALASYDLSQFPDWARNNLAEVAAGEQAMIRAGASPDYAKWANQNEIAQMLEGFKAAGVGGIG